MRYFVYTSVGMICFFGVLTSGWGQDVVTALDPVLVEAEREKKSFMAGREYVVGPAALRNGDPASAVKNLPGAAVVRNGAQTGILQLRGLSGERVCVRVDGMEITPACPNHMDPPLHYASASGKDLVSLYAGIPPVSMGGNRTGGALDISRPDPVFAEKGKDVVLFEGGLGGAYRGSQDAWSGRADFNYGQGDLSFQYRGSAATAEDLRFPGGRARDTGYDTMHHEFVGAWRTGGGFVSMDVGYLATRDAGTPALPMDMIRDDAWHVGLRQKEVFSWGEMESRFYVHDIDHLMDNYSLRPSPRPGMGTRMESPTSSRDYGLRSDFLLPRGENDLRVGLDVHRNEFDADQVAVDSGMRRDSFHDALRHRVGLYADCEREWSDKWNSRIGVRGDFVSSSAKAVNNGILPPPGPMRTAVLNDQREFNAAERSFNEFLVDAVAALRFEQDAGSSMELAFAVKNRAPSMLERYSWTPSNASAGMADGRRYLGNLELDPETSFQIGLGMEKRGERWSLEMTPFYQIVRNYIQGMPINRFDSTGQSVLEYQNLDRADLFGCEFAAGVSFNEVLDLDLSVSYVRGKNKDNGDDLYRIAPLHGLVDLSYESESWESHLEWMWADAQKRVSTLQGEAPSSGYGVLNFRLARIFAKSVRWEMGVENLMDARYADHLSGVNRVRGGDLSVGERVPGAGRFAYTSISWDF